MVKKNMMTRQIECGNLLKEFEKACEEIDDALSCQTNCDKVSCAKAYCEVYHPDIPKLPSKLIKTLRGARHGKEKSS